MKSLKFGNVVLCDYVARGHNNKFNLVNAISGDVIVGEMPADLVFGIYLELLAQAGQGPDFSLDVVVNDEILASVDGKGNTTDVGRVGTIAIPMIPMHLEDDGVLEVYVSAPGFKRTRALHRKIIKGVLPTSASSPPSEQSQPDAQDSSSRPEPSRRAAPTKRRRSKAQ